MKNTQREIFTVLQFVLFFLLILGIAGCTLTQWTTQANYKGEGSGLVTEEHALAIKMPDTGTGPFPAIIFMHSGGWFSGDYEDTKQDCIEAAKKGFVGISINYRLTGYNAYILGGEKKNPWPAQLEDAKAAVAWVRSHASTYRINPDKIGVAGISAGGLLSLTLGLTNHAQDQTWGTQSDVQAVCAIAAPTHLLSCALESPNEYNWVMPTYLLGVEKSVVVKTGSCGDCSGDDSYCYNGTCYTDTSGTFKLASPYYRTPKNFGIDLPPIQLIIGGGDTVVPPASQFNRFYARLQTWPGTEEQLKFGTDCLHDFLQVDANGKSYDDKRVAAMLDFFTRKLKNTH